MTLALVDKDGQRWVWMRTASGTVHLVLPLAKRPLWIEQRCRPMAGHIDNAARVVDAADVCPRWCRRCRMSWRAHLATNRQQPLPFGVDGANR
jgi:hypothetical protein